MYLEIKNSSNQLISRIYNKLNRTGAIYWVEVELSTSTSATYSYIGIKNKATSRTIYFPIGASLIDKTYKYTLFTANDELTVPYYRYIPNYEYDGDTPKQKAFADRLNRPAISSKKFINWNSKSDGSGTKYYSAGSFDVTKNISSSSNIKKVKLYAQWSNVSSGTSYTTTWVGAKTATYAAGAQFNELPGSGSRIDEYSRNVYDDSYSLGPATINSVNIVTTFPSPAIKSYSGSVNTSNTERPNGTVSWTLDLYDLGRHDNSIDIGYSFKAKYSRADGYSTWVSNKFEIAFYKNSARTQEAAARRYDGPAYEQPDGWHYTLLENGVYKYVGFLAYGNSKQQFAPLSEEYSIYDKDYNAHLVSKFTGSEGIITVPYPDIDPSTGIATLTLYPSVIWIKKGGSDPKFELRADNLASFTTSSIDYSVYYNKNCYDDVSNLPERGVKQYNAPYTLSTLIPERSGYIFKGWNLGASEPTEDFPGIPMQPGDVIPASNNDGHYILYAQWKKEEYDYDSEIEHEPIMFLVHKKPQVLISAKRYSLEEPDRVVLVQKPVLEDLPDENGEDKNFVSSTSYVRYREEKRGQGWPVPNAAGSGTKCYESRLEYSNPEYPTWQTYNEDSPVLTNNNGIFRIDIKEDSAKTSDRLLGIDKEWQLQTKIYDALCETSELTYKEGTKRLGSDDKYDTESDFSNIALLLKYVTKLLVHNPLVDEVLKETRNNKKHREGSNPPETDFWQIREHTQNSAESKTVEEFINSLLDLRGQAPTEKSGGSVNGFTEQQIKNYIIPTLLRELRENERLVYDPSQVTPLIKMLYQINSDHDKIRQEYTELTEQENYSGIDVGDMTSATKLDNKTNNGRILELDGERHQTDTNWETEPDSLENRVLDTDFQKVELANFENEQVEDDAQSTIDYISNYDISQLDLKTSLSDLLYILSRMTPRGYDPTGEHASDPSDRWVTGAKDDYNDSSKDSTNMSNYWDSTNNRFKDSAFTNWIPSEGKWKTPENNLAEYDNPIEDYSVLVNTDSLDKNNSYGDNDFLNNGCRATCMGLCTTGCYQTCVGGCKTACGDSCFFGCKNDCKSSCGGKCTTSCLTFCTGTCNRQCEDDCGGTCSGTCSGSCTGSCGLNCSGSCEAACKKDCDSDCKNKCKSTCSGNCGSACSGTCQNGCKTSCSGTCKGSCGNGCNKACSTACSGGCSNNCATSCGSGCESNCKGECNNMCVTGCKNTCVSGCGNGCTKGCEDGCYQGCTKECTNSCRGKCQDGCVSTCGSNCSSNCKTTCKTVCGSACANLCDNTCATACNSSCRSGCIAKCKSSCKASCSAGCMQGCSDFCSESCASYCLDSCDNMCLTSCKESCTSTCSGLCYSSCGENCSGDCLFTCSNDCLGGCYTTCKGDCKKNCKSSCVNLCNRDCGSNCTRACNSACGYSCGGGCTSSCGANCTGTCSKNCETNCSGSCGSDCKGTCKANCGGACTSGCQTTCKTTCGKTCSTVCTAACSDSCKETCKERCYSGCATGCSGACKNSCEASCSTGCVTGCKSNCSTSCSASCSGGCGNGCTGTCLNTCSGTCSGTCESSCVGTCKGACGSGCDNSCNTSCEETCYESCHTACTGSAYKISA